MIIQMILISCLVTFITFIELQSMKSTWRNMLIEKMNSWNISRRILNRILLFFSIFLWFFFILVVFRRFDWRHKIIHLIIG